MKASLAVLAAGMGSRYGGLKQIDPVGPSGEIILDYSICDALRAGFSKLVFVVRKDIDGAFRESVGARWERHVEVEYAHQEIDAIPSPYKVPAGRSKPWGTGHAVLCAASKMDGPFAAVNADDFYGRSGYELLFQSLAKAQGDNATPRHFMVGFKLRNTLSEHGSVSRGICRSGAGGLLQGIVERTSIAKDAAGNVSFTDESGNIHALSGEETASMNMWGFMPSVMPELERLFKDFLSERGGEAKSEFYLPAAVATLIQEGRAEVETLQSKDSWFGVTYREDKPMVQSAIARLVEDGVYSSPLKPEGAGR